MDHMKILFRLQNFCSSLTTTYTLSEITLAHEPLLSFSVPTIFRMFLTPNKKNNYNITSALCVKFHSNIFNSTIKFTKVIFVMK